MTSSSGQIIKCIPTDANNIDIFTKNMMSTVFNHHMPLYVGHDGCMKAPDQALIGEAV
jgi:hypothetical protein